MIKIANVVGARPNFVKIAPILRAMRPEPEIHPILIHTGQHYDYRMNQAFFEDLNIPEADVSLGVGSGSHASQTANILVAFEAWCLQAKPDLVLVVGDVNSTIACALAAKKLNIPVAHVEAGLRSGDMAMPEEINRRCTDAISDQLFVSEQSGVDNLTREGHPAGNIHFVGNVMIDTLFERRAAAAALGVRGRLGLRHRGYGIVTLHRPSNIDDPHVLLRLLHSLKSVSQRLPLIFPMHPRTRAMIKKADASQVLTGPGSSVTVVEPMRYLEFVSLLQDAALVITDSGGLQEETTALGVPCVTMRANTERPITCELGTNTLIGDDPQFLEQEVLEVLARPWPETPQIAKWDGHSAQRIVTQLSRWQPI